MNALSPSCVNVEKKCPLPDVLFDTEIGESIWLYLNNLRNST